MSANPYFSVKADQNMKPLAIVETIITACATQLGAIVEDDGKPCPYSEVLFLMEMNLRMAEDLLETMQLK